MPSPRPELPYVPLPHHALSLPLSCPDSPPSPPTWRRLLAMAGLPCLISVAAIDPGNLEVDLQAGLNWRYGLIWAVLLASVAGFALQTLAAQLTILTDMHLAQLFAYAYKDNWLLKATLFVFAELSIVAFDIAEVVGTAFALQLLFGWPLWIGMIMSALDTVLVLYLQRKGLSQVEVFIEGLLVVLAACLFYEFALSKPDAGGILKGVLVPGFGSDVKEGMLLSLGILGSVIMGHNLYLHSWLIKGRDGAAGREPIAREREGEMRYVLMEAAVIFSATFAINSAVMSISAALDTGDLKVTGEDIGLKDAGLLLRNVLGTKWAVTAWGVALLASGHAATVTGSLASQAVCEGYLGLRDDGSDWGPMVMLTRVIAIVPALIGGLIAGEGGADRLIVVSQVILSLTLPFAVVPLFKVWRGIGQSGGVFLCIGLGMFTVLIAGNVYILIETLKAVWIGSGVFAASCFTVVVMICVGLMTLVCWSEVAVGKLHVAGQNTIQSEAEKLLGKKVEI